MQLFTNNAKSSLGSAIGTGDTTIALTVGGGAKYPAPTGGDYFLLTLFEYGSAGEQNHEIVKCTARTADSLTVVRAQEGTAARAWGAGTPIELRVTKETLERFVAEGDSIGGTTPAAGTFSSLTATTADINGGTIDGTTIGGTTAAAGSFTSATLGDTTGISGTGTYTAGLFGSAANQTLAFQSPDAGQSNLYFGNTTDWTRGGIVYANSTEDMVFYTDNMTERFRLGGETVFNEGGADIDFRVESDTVDHAFFVQGSDGHVGIGTSSPADALEVMNASYRNQMRANRNVVLANGNAAGAITLSGGNSASATANITYASIGAYAQTATAASEAGALIFETYASGALGERMRINSAGNVGIGTSSPNGKLTLNAGASDASLYIQTTNTGGTATDGFSIAVENATSDVYLNQRESANLRFLTSSTERLRITSTGEARFRSEGDYYFYGDNGNNDDFALYFGSDDTIGAETSSRAAIFFDATNNNAGNLEIFTKRDAGALTRAMRIDYLGDIYQYRDDGTTVGTKWDASVGYYGIGTSSPSSLLNVVAASNGVDDDIITLGFAFDAGTEAMGSIGTHNLDANNGGLKFSSRRADVLTEMLRIGSAETVFNEDGLDQDFRVESDTKAHALFVDGANGFVGLGTSSTTNAHLTISGGAAVTNNANAIDGTRLLSIGSDTPVTIETFTFGRGGYTSNGNQYSIIQLQPSVGDNTYNNGHYIASHRPLTTTGSGNYLELGQTIRQASGGSTTSPWLYLSSAASSTTRKASYYVSSSGGTQTFFLGKLRAGSSIDGMCDITVYQANDYGQNPASRLEVSIKQRAGSLAGLAKRFGQIATSNASRIKVVTNNASVDMEVWYEVDDFIGTQIDVNYTAGSDWAWSQQIVSSTAGYTTLWNSDDNEKLVIKTNEFVINESSADVDFRVESNNNMHMLFVDGGSDYVGVGTSAPIAPLNAAGPSGTVLRLDTTNASGDVFINLAPKNAASSICNVSLNAESEENSFASAFYITTRSSAGTNTERMRITSTGRVGIANDTPNNTLSVGVFGTEGAATNNGFMLAGRHIQAFSYTKPGSTAVTVRVRVHNYAAAFLDMNYVHTNGGAGYYAFGKYHISNNNGTLYIDTLHEDLTTSNGNVTKATGSAGTGADGYFEFTFAAGNGSPGTIGFELSGIRTGGGSVGYFQIV